MIDDRQRQRNEKAFGSWDELPAGGRRYWHDVKGRLGWSARYVKEVGTDEMTVRFYQEIYDEQGVLREIHQKFPQDLGHQKIGK